MVSMEWKLFDNIKLHWETSVAIKSAFSEEKFSPLHNHGKIKEFFRNMPGPESLFIYQTVHDNWVILLYNMCDIKLKIHMKYIKSKISQFSSQSLKLSNTAIIYINTNDHCSKI